MSYNENTGMYEGYIYCLTNMKSKTYKKYIGQTTTTIKHRLGQHLTSSKKYAIHYAMDKYGKENFKVEQICKIIANTKKELIEKLNKEERFCIEWYQTKCEQNGYNIDNGGNQVSYFCKPVDVYTLDGQFIRTFESQSEAERYYDIYDVCDMCNGKINKNVKYNITFRYHGEPFDKYNPDYYKRNKTYYQFDLDGNLINTFSRKKYVFEYLWNKLGIKATSPCIDKAIEKNTTAYGYVWSLDGKFHFDKNTYRNCVKVKKYSIDGNLLGIYNSISDALLFIGKTSTGVNNIKLSCDGKTFYPRYGYVWRYINDEFEKYPVVLEFQGKKVCVDQYTLDGKFIGTFKSISEALVKSNIPVMYTSQITQCCKGNKAFAQGYVWRFHGEPFDKYDTKIKHSSVKISKYSLDDIYLETYNSCKEAAEDVGLKSSSIIIQCAKGKRKTAGGFKWYYADDIDQPDKTKIITIN